MSYYTTVVTVNKEGKPVKSEIHAGGRSRGFTDERTGELTFETYSNSTYTVTAKRMGSTVSGQIRGGRRLVLRFGK